MSLDYWVRTAKKPEADVATDPSVPTVDQSPALTGPLEFPTVDELAPLGSLLEPPELPEARARVSERIRADELADNIDALLRAEDAAQTEIGRLPDPGEPPRQTAARTELKQFLERKGGGVPTASSRVIPFSGREGYQARKTGRSFKSERQVKKSALEKLFESAASINPVAGPAALSLQQLWRQAGRPGIPTSLDEARQTVDRVLAAPLIDQPSLGDVVKAAPGIGFVARGAETAAGLVSSVAGMVTGEAQGKADQQTTQPALVVGQLLSTAQRPFQTMLKVAEEQNYIRLKMNEAAKFRKLKKGGAVPEQGPDGIPRILDPTTGDYVEDAVTFELEPDGDRESTLKYYVQDPVNPAKRIKLRTRGEMLKDVASSVSLPDQPQDEPSFIEGTQMGLLNLSADPNADPKRLIQSIASTGVTYPGSAGVPPPSKAVQYGGAALGLVADFVLDPANLISFGDQSARRAGKQVQKIVERSYKAAGVEDAAGKARAFGKFAAQAYGRGKAPSRSLVASALRDPSDFADFQRILSLREVAVESAEALAESTSRALTLAEEAGDTPRSLGLLERKARKAQEAVIQAAESLAEWHRKLGALPTDPVEGVVTRRDVLRTLADGVRSIGDEKAAREIERLGYRWGVSGLEIGVGPNKYELWSAKRKALPLSDSVVKDAGKLLENLPEDVLATAADRLTGQPIRKTGVRLASAAASAVRDAPLTVADDYEDIMRVADVLHDGMDIRQKEALRTASDLAWKARRTPKELEGVHAVVQLPYKRGESRSLEIVRKAAAELDPGLPSPDQQERFLDVFATKLRDQFQDPANFTSQVTDTEGIRKDIRRLVGSAAGETGRVLADEIPAERLRSLESAFLTGQGEGIVGGPFELFEGLMGDVPEGVLKKASDLVEDLPSLRKEIRARMSRAFGTAAGVVLTPEQQETLRIATQYAYAKAMIHSDDAEGAASWWATHAEKYIQDVLEESHDIEPQPLKGLIAEGATTIAEDASDYHAGIAGMDEGMKGLTKFLTDRMSQMVKKERSLGIPVGEIVGYLPQVTRRVDPSDSLNFLGDTAAKSATPGFVKGRTGDFYGVSDPVTNVMQLLAYRTEAHELIVRKYEFLGEMARRFGRKMKPGEAPREGFRTIERFVKGKPVQYEVAPHVANGISKVEELWSPDNLGPFLATVNSVQNYWKPRVTAGRAPFHVRNSISNLAQMWVGGVTNPANAVRRGIWWSLAGYAQDAKAADLIRRVSKGSKFTGRSKLDKFSRFIADQLISSGQKMARETVTSKATGLTFTKGALYRKAQELGVLDTGWVGADTTRDLVRDFSRSPGYTPAREAVEIVRSLDPTGLSTAGKGGISPNKFLPIRMGGAGGRFIENSSRYGTFLDAILEKGMSFQDAAKEADRILFDYSPGSLTAKERKLKVGVPFYIWLRRNLPFQMEALYRRPGRASGQHKVFRGMERLYEQQRKELESRDKWIDREDLPGYLRESMAVRASSQAGANDRNGTAFLWNPGFTHSDLNNLDPSRDNLLGMITPVAKVPIEILRGKKLATREQRFESPTSRKMVPVSPLMAKLGQILGLKVQAVGVEGDPDRWEWTAPAQLPYLLQTMLPDVEQWMKLVPELSGPDGLVPVSPKREIRKSTRRIGLVPGFSGTTVEPIPQRTRRIRGLLQDVKDERLPFGKVILRRKDKKEEIKKKKKKPTRLEMLKDAEERMRKALESIEE